MDRAHRTQTPPRTQSFLVRVWLERREIPGAEPLLRGSIEHLGTGGQRFLKGLEEIPAFIAPHLETRGGGTERSVDGPGSGTPPLNGRAG